MSGYSFANASRITSIAASVTGPTLGELEPEQVELALEVSGADAEDRAADRRARRGSMNDFAVCSGCR
jgi:hypothetical protein